MLFLKNSFKMFTSLRIQVCIYLVHDVCLNVQHLFLLTFTVTSVTHFSVSQYEHNALNTAENPRRNPAVLRAAVPPVVLLLCLTQPPALLDGTQLSLLSEPLIDVPNVQRFFYS